MPGSRVKPDEIVRFRGLARAGWTLYAIAKETGRAHDTVRPYIVGFAKPRPGPARNIARHRRMVVAASAVDFGVQAELAGRFGYANRQSFSVGLSKSRRILASLAEARQETGPLSKAGDSHAG